MFVFLSSFKNGNSKLSVKTTSGKQVEDRAQHPSLQSASLHLAPPPSNFHNAFLLHHQHSSPRKKVLQVREGLHSVATLNFNVTHGHVCSNSSQYLIQQLERLWGATENIYYTRIVVVFIYFLLCHLTVIFLHFQSLAFCQFTLPCCLIFSEIMHDCFHASARSNTS